MALFGGLFSKEKKESLDKGLEKSKDSFFSKLGKAVMGKSKVDEEVLDDLEEVLITSDVGVSTTIKIIERIEERVARDKYLGVEELDQILREEIAGLLAENNTSDLETFELPIDKRPYVMLGVYVFAIFGMIVGGIRYQVPEFLATFCLNALLLVQVSWGAFRGLGGVWSGRRRGVWVG